MAEGLLDGPQVALKASHLVLVGVSIVLAGGVQAVLLTQSESLILVSVDVGPGDYLMHRYL